LFVPMMPRDTRAQSAGINVTLGKSTTMWAERRVTRVLFAQEPSDDVDMYVEFFAAHGVATTVVFTADDALAAALETDVIVTDIPFRTNDTNTDVITVLRKDTRTRSIPVIALTARVFDPDRQRAEGAGYDLFLFKPCLPDELLRRVRALLSRNSDRHRQQ